jgi:hypothetical protein
MKNTLTPLSKSIKSVIVGVVSGDESRQSRRGIVRDGGGLSVEAGWLAKWVGFCRSRREEVRVVRGLSER